MFGFFSLVDLLFGEEFLCLSALIFLGLQPTKHIESDFLFGEEIQV